MEVLSSKWGAGAVGGLAPDLSNSQDLKEYCHLVGFHVIKAPANCGDFLIPWELSRLVGYHVKKAPATKSASSSGSTGGGRVSKAAAIESLTAAITDAGQEVDEEIVSKLTGKAANYFAGIIAAVNS